MACKAYNIQSCRLPRRPNSEFCSTCLLNKQKSQMNKNIQYIQDSSIPNEDILKMFESEEFKTLLSTNLIWEDVLDTVLGSTYKRSRPLLHKLIEIIQKYSITNTNLVVRIANHSKTQLCPVFMHMMITNLIDEPPTTYNCIRCFAYKISYSDYMLITDSFKLWNDCKNLLKRELGTEKFFFAAYDIIRAFTESSRFSIKKDDMELFITNVVNLAKNSGEHSPEEIQEFMKKIYEQPIMILQHMNIIKPFMKKHTASWKVGWLAKVLHPSRAHAWCSDIEEQEELKSMGIMINYTLPEKGKKAEWDIAF